MIPETAFQHALDQTAYRSADASAINLAVSVNAVVNDRNSLGVFGEVSANIDVQPFSGNIFLVVRDAALSPDGQFVEAHDFFVAAVELSGTSPWIGTNARGTLRAGRSGITGRCCGESTICVPVQPEPNPCRFGFCPGINAGITTILPETLEREISLDRTVIAGTDRPVAELIIYPSKALEQEPLSVHETPDSSILFRYVISELLTGATVSEPRIGSLIDLMSPSGGPLIAPTTDIGPIVLGCTEVIDPACTLMLPVCEPDSVGWEPGGGGGDSGSGSSACVGGAPAGSRYVPKICTMIMDWEHLPPICGGFCEHCPDLSNWDGVPPGCTMMEFLPGSNICQPQTPESRARDNLILQVQAGWLPGHEARTCEPSTAGGGQVCTVCDAGGECHIEVDIPKVDPTVASTSTDDENTCRTCKFEGMTLEGEISEVCEGECTMEEIDVLAESGGLEPPSDDPPTPVIPDAPDPSLPAASTDDNPVEPDNSTEPFYWPDQPSTADPVLIGDGAFELELTDLSFNGPVRPLVFSRAYNSRSQERSALGSNWSHNWDVWLQPLNEETAPAWTLPYCAGSEVVVTCLILHESNGMQLFFRDPGSGVFMPQAGSTDTIVADEIGGIVLRGADGHNRYFNSFGYLTEDRDRFGNGFTVEYQQTPLFDLYRHYCSIEARQLPSTVLSAPPCAALAYLLGDRARPEPSSDAWRVTAEDYPLPDDPDLAEQLAYAREYFLYIISDGSYSGATFGTRKLRPVKVLDDMGRTLEFGYYRADTITTRDGGITYDFGGMPHAELLAFVHGPVGTTLEFLYETPPNYPAEMNDVFLVEVRRADVLTEDISVLSAPNRNAEYIYQWSGGPTTAYDANGYADAVYARYLLFYQTFVGCRYQEMQCGVAGNERIATGDPVVLAAHERHAYIGDVADNILHVRTNGVSNSESRYEIDPFSQSFDRVVAQRFGSSVTLQNISLLPVDDPLFGWETSLPRTSFSFTEAGPSSSSTDQTELTLPKEIQQRYPLETAIIFTSVETIPSAIEPIETDGEIRACNYELRSEYEQQLPGYRDSIPYYDPLPEQRTTDAIDSLFRTRLSCNQLAVSQLSDPTHNDLLHTLIPIMETPFTGDHVAKRIVGRRAIVATNVNRICSWVQSVDRNGISRYYGLNYRGQILVDAVFDVVQQQFVFTEYLYNADGMLIQERRPSAGPQPWQLINGYTTYHYDEIDPLDNRGWDSWRPVFWTRRMNLIRQEEWAADITVVNEQEYPFREFVNANGRYQAFTYEPFFNQLQSVEVGTIETRPSPDNTMSVLTLVPHTRTNYVFDYQELSIASGISPELSLDPVLDYFEAFGFAWVRDSQGNIDRGVLADWQLPLEFHGRDLNGDGKIGFGYGAEEFHRARGVPILAFEISSMANGSPRTTAFTWAPHGQLSNVLGPDGTSIQYEYYPLQSIQSSTATPFGTGQAPTDEDLNIGYRGFLGRIRMKLFPTTFHPYPESPREEPCPTLAGPFQWLLSAACATDPEHVRQELAALGLPQETIEAILAASGAAAADQWVTTAFNYSTIGEIDTVWMDAGVTTSTTYDTDSRVREYVDPAGNRATLTYTLPGFQESERVVEQDGDLLEEMYWEYDEEGRVIYECIALASAGCVPSGRANPVDAAVQQYEYWPEGQLRRSVDSEGLVTEFDYDVFQQLVRQVESHPTVTTTREVTYTYTLDGDVETIHYGQFAIAGQPSLTERYSYDGLRRLRSHVDSRGTTWQFAFTTRDSLAAFKLDTSGYGEVRSEVSPPTWETRFQYDVFGNLKTRTDNGILTDSYLYDRDGRLYGLFGVGKGFTYLVQDYLGQTVWMRDEVGNQFVDTWEPTTQIVSRAALRHLADGTTYTTATVAKLDNAGETIHEIEYGANGEEREWHWLRDGHGLIIEEINPEGYRIWIERNLAGWSVRQGEQRTDGTNPIFDISQFTYNRRGQFTSVVDPNGQTSTTAYDIFGQVESQSLPGVPPVLSTYAYDTLGRINIARIGSEEIKYHYDAQGDAVGESLVQGSQLVPLAERTFDELGRVRQSWSYNPALNWLPAGEATVTNSLGYDSLGRVVFDQLQVGSHAPREVQSTWTILPRERWQRRFEYPLSDRSNWIETYDEIGRMESKERVLPASGTISTTFRWIGEWYAGREQEQDGTSSPFKQALSLDGYGLPIEWQYTAIGLDAQLNPLDSAEGVRYCGASWDTAACGQPLLKISALRDRMGRIASLGRQYGHPVFDNGTRIAVELPRPWRGYSYGPAGSLEQTWEHNGITDLVTIDELRSHEVTDDEVAGIGVSATQWVYEREDAVGSLVAVANASGSGKRWSTSLRDPGYQLNQVDVDGITTSIVHDHAGRIIDDGTRVYRYDAYGRLAVVEENSVVVEAYAYDERGRLAATFSAAGFEQSFLYDDMQMVAAYDDQGDAIWEAAWGPQLDQLLEWRNLSAGMETYIPLADPRNSITATWHVEAARITGLTDYNPEGRVRVSSSNAQELCNEQAPTTVCAYPSSLPFGFVSAWRSTETGLTNMRSRWYSPALGQFLTHDPLGYASSYNLYAYADMDPINSWDPFGTDPGNFTSDSPTATSSAASSGNQASKAGFFDGLPSLGELWAGIKRYRGQTLEERIAEHTEIWRRQGLSPDEARQRAIDELAGMNGLNNFNRELINQLLKGRGSGVRPPAIKPRSNPGNGKVGRLPQDKRVNPTPPKPRPTTRPVGKSPTQNAVAQRIVEQLRRAGYTKIRVNQQQVNAAGQRVGTNRPDIQATDPYGKRVYIELERPGSPRGLGHRQRLLANDPAGKVVILEVP